MYDTQKLPIHSIYIFKHLILSFYSYLFLSNRDKPPGGVWAGTNSSGYLTTSPDNQAGCPTANRHHAALCHCCSGKGSKVVPLP